MRKNFWSVGKLTRVGVLGALSAILYVFPEIPVIPPIYKLDFSSIPALLAGFAMGPATGVLVTLIKDLTGLFHTSTMGVGDLADFLMSGTFVAIASLIYRHGRGIKSAVAGMCAATVAMALVGAAANYWIMVPFYANVMHMSVETIVGVIAKAIPAVDSLWKMILLAVVPFNLLKGAVLSLIGGLMYRYLKPLLTEGKAHA